ncbi:DUF3365 domain-containing protein [Uliginosibacterium sp. H3]|uniref:DUF3365 domain-containing protein n=1 Tax=Uliginosibacterium silvisoli TaxID=3114758 RepID=A0ABU6K882_9RHOO|nr:DUF3365 domain-containing protein [Uliginosibacterium sp. H3]
MRIETRFGWIIAFCFVLGVSIAGYVSYTLESRQARDEVMQKAQMLLDTALAVRSYTVDEVAPVVKEAEAAHASGTDAGKFRAQQVPSFAAQSAMRRLTKNYPEYTYRETSLNPTNIVDRASDWEVGLIRAYQDDGKLKELSGQLGEGANERFYVTRPIRLSNPACLECHSTADVAPKAMIAKYGASNGFGWKLNDVVGLQVVEVPVAPTRHKAISSFLVTIGSLTCVFILTSTIFLLLLRRHVTRPLEAITRSAHDISLNRRTNASPSSELQAEGGQFRDLHEAISRLKASVDGAVEAIRRHVPGASGADTKPPHEG